jgi:hypothetical protein
MSLDIWTQCAEHEVEAFHSTVFRSVVPGAGNTTRKYVDSDSEHDALEAELDGHKPPYPRGAHHVLIASAFRYPPLKWGSRFGTINENSLFYAALEERTSMAERAYYQLRFVSASAGLLDNSCTLNIFTVAARAPNTINLASLPFKNFAKEFLAPDSYSHSQPLGAAMRRTNIPLFRYPSVRLDGGTNVGIFQMSAIMSHRPMTETYYTLLVKNDEAILQPLGSSGNTESFPRRAFEVDGIFPVAG